MSEQNTKPIVNVTWDNKNDNLKKMSDDSASCSLLKIFSLESSCYSEESINVISQTPEADLGGGVEGARPPFQSFNL